MRDSRLLKRKSATAIADRRSWPDLGGTATTATLINLYRRGDSAHNVEMNPPTDPTEEASLAGFDLNLIEMNLSLSPGERWRQHDMALEVILELEEARMARDARLQTATTTAR